MAQLCLLVAWQMWQILSLAQAGCPCPLAAHRAGERCEGDGRTSHAAYKNNCSSVQLVQAQGWPTHGKAMILRQWWQIYGLCFTDASRAPCHGSSGNSGTRSRPREMGYSTSSIRKDRCCKADITLELSCVHFLQITMTHKDKVWFQGSCVWLDLYQPPDVLT